MVWVLVPLALLLGWVAWFLARREEKVKPISSRGGSQLSLTGRIERPSFYRGGFASKKDCLAAPSPDFTCKKTACYSPCSLTVLIV
jgi:hypothetical protein